MGSHIEIIARGLITAGPHVLLCRSVKVGYRYLPGGHVEFGEAAAEALAREIREECGRESTVGDLVFLSEERFHDGKRHRHELNLVFRARLMPVQGGVGQNVRGGVFHVEHPPASAPPLRSEPGAPAAGRDHAQDPEGTTPPAPVESLEPKIAFDWVRVGELAAADVRPRSIRDWLLSLRQDGSGQLAAPSPAWRP